MTTQFSFIKPAKKDQKIADNPKKYTCTWWRNDNKLLGKKPKKWKLLYNRRRDRKRTYRSLTLKSETSNFWREFVQCLSHSPCATDISSVAHGEDSLWRTERRGFFVRHESYVRAYIRAPRSFDYIYFPFFF